MTSIRYLSLQEVIAINVALIQKYSPGEQIGVKNRSLLESALLRPQSSAFGEAAYPYSFEMEPKAAEDWTVDMVNHRYSLEQLAETIDSHCRR